MQPLSIFYPLKDLKNLVNKKTLPFICNYLILSELPVVDFIYLFFFIILIYIMYNFLFFLVFPDSLDFQCLVIVIF